MWTFKENAVLYRVVVDKDGYIYTKSSTGRIIKISPDGKEVWRISQSQILDLACDGKGNIYVNFYATVKKISPDGKEVWDYHSEVFSNSYFAVDNEGYVYVFMNAMHIGSSAKSQFKKISPTGKEVATATMDVFELRHTTIDQYKNIYAYKYNGSSGPNAVVKLSQDMKEIWRVPEEVSDLTVDKVGNIYAACTDSIKKISPDGKILWSYPIANNSVTAIITEQSPYGAFPFLWE
ncbi:hypothetical protein U3450_003876 [Bacillus cytotoxicus]|nr:hypothetical protein [Bacillus cytotoxicus]